MKKIRDIKIFGHMDYRRVTPWDYGKTRRNFAGSAEPVALPSWEELDRIGDKDELWILLQPIVVVIFFSKYKLVYRFKKGFIFDKASTPAGRNNVLESMPGVLVHDANFSNHHFNPGDNKKGFRATNVLFYRMLRYFGMNFFRASFYYLSVNSIVGRALYEKNDRDFWHRKTVEFERVKIGK